MSANRLTPCRRRGGAVILAGVFLVSACGVPTGGGTRTIEPESVPFGLLRERQASPSETTGSAARPGEIREQIALVEDGAQMHLVERDVADGAAIATAGLLLTQLQNGPTDAERLRGLESAVTAGMELQVISLRRSVLTVDVSGEAAQAPDRLPLAIAQIVFTATSAPGVRAVLFEHGGTPLPVPLIDGSLTSTVLSPKDYPAALIPAPTRRATRPGR